MTVDTQTGRVQDDASDSRALSYEVLLAVADHEGVEPTELEPPLYETVDPDALDSLFSSEEAGGTTSFSYRGLRVTAHSNGRVLVREDAQ